EPDFADGQLSAPPLHPTPGRPGAQRRDRPDADPDAGRPADLGHRRLQGVRRAPAGLGQGGTAAGGGGGLTFPSPRVATRGLEPVWLAQEGAVMKVTPKRGGQLEELAGEIRVCTKCPLHESRTLAVPGEGKKSARVMVIGEAPGGEEDKAGRPFVGASGR